MRNTSQPQRPDRRLPPVPPPPSEGKPSSHIPQAELLFAIAMGLIFAVLAFSMHWI